jgi:hypothetical protein
MQTFEESWNFVLCGVFLLILVALCSAVFSFITVQYPLHPSKEHVVNTRPLLANMFNDCIINSRLRSVECYNNGWWIEKELARISRGLFYGNIRIFTQWGWRKPRNPSVNLSVPRPKFETVIFRVQERSITAWLICIYALVMFAPKRNFKDGIWPKSHVSRQQSPLSEHHISLKQFQFSQKPKIRIAFII